MSQTSAQGTPLPGQKGFWRALYNKMLADLENDSWRRMQSYQIAGRVLPYRNLEGYLNLLKMVQDKADVEDGTLSYRGRTYAGQGGRG
jgi:hypothetical protein